jgi:hypothetical protein
MCKEHIRFKNILQKEGPNKTNTIWNINSCNKLGMPLPIYRWLIVKRRGVGEGKFRERLIQTIEYDNLEEVEDFIDVIYHPSQLQIEYEEETENKELVRDWLNSYCELYFPEENIKFSII